MNCKKLLAGTTLIWMFFLVTAFAAEKTQKFPFIGRAKTDNVNIRAGGNQNFEILSKINNEDLIYVNRKIYGWYEVGLPKTAACYVYKKFIEKNGQSWISGVNGLNLRARPNTESSVIGQLQKGEIVIVLNEDSPEWQRIAPPENCYGWIRADLIEYYSDKKAIQAKNPAAIQDPVSRLKSFSADGKIKKIGWTLRKKPAGYKLIKDGHAVCYLKSNVCNLKRFRNKNVFIEGYILATEYDKPLINIVSIKPAE